MRHWITPTLILIATLANTAELQTRERLLHAFAGTAEADTPAPVLSFARVEPFECDAQKSWHITTTPAPYPSLYFKLPAAEDWSGYAGLAVDIRNTGKDTLRIALRIDDDLSADGSKHCRTGDAVIEPGDSGTYIIAFGANPASLGMKALPGLDGVKTVGSAGAGAFDYSHIVAYQIFLVRPSQEHTFTLGNMRLLPGQKQDFNHIVDAFGQYTRQQWPGKIATVAELKTCHDNESKSLAAHPSLPGRTQFGGWLDGPQLPATGFFRTAKHNNKWSLVDPDGRLFLSVGPTTVGMGNPTLLTGREHMFSVLPGADATLAKFTRTNDEKQTETLDFYMANLFRKYGDDYRNAWKDITLRRFQAWGCNTIGAFSAWDFNANAKVPYTFTVWVWGRHTTLPNNMSDVFDPQFAIDVADTLNAIPQHVRNDPFLIGYFVGNEQNWGYSGVRSHYVISLGALAQDAEKSAAKRAFIDQLKTKYPQIAQLNAAWQTTFDNWQNLEPPFNPKDPLPDDMQRDLSDFLAHYARTYFQIVRDNINKASPNHLYLGCRFAGHPKEVLDAAIDFHDVLSFNIYQTVPAANFMRDIDKPIVIGEFHFGATDRGMFGGGLLTVADQAARASAYRNYLRAVWEHPNFVGAHWFQYTDQPLTGRPADGENGNVGLVDITDSPYPELIDALKAAHAEMYDLRFGK